MKLRLQLVAAAAAALFAAIAASAQSAPVSPEHLSSRQLSALAAGARTPEEHEQVALYYEMKADWYRARAQEHAIMVARWMANPATNNEKTRFGTVNHCEFLFRSLNQRARQAHKLALEQEQMAQIALAE